VDALPSEGRSGVQQVGGVNGTRILALEIIELKRAGKG
jgi:hypothetical protein